MKFSRFIVSFLILTTLAFSTDLPEKEKKQVQAQQFQVIPVIVTDYPFGVSLNQEQAYILHERGSGRHVVRMISQDKDGKGVIVDVGGEFTTLDHEILRNCGFTNQKHAGVHTLLLKENTLGEAHHLDPEKGMISYKIRKDEQQRPLLRMVVPQKGKKDTPLPPCSQLEGVFQGKPVRYRMSPLVNSRSVVVIGDIIDKDKVTGFSLLRVDARARKVAAAKVTSGIFGCVLLDDYVVEIEHGAYPSKHTTLTYYNVNDLSFAGRDEHSMFFDGAYGLISQIHFVGFGNAVLSYLDDSTSGDLYLAQLGQKRPLLKNILGEGAEGDSRYFACEGSKAVLVCTSTHRKKHHAFLIQPPEADSKLKDDEKGDRKESNKDSEKAGSGESANADSLNSSTSKTENNG